MVKQKLIKYLKLNCVIDDADNDKIGLKELIE